MPPHSLFVYGTLMYPKILERVMRRAASDVQLQDAILNDHVRLHIHGEDYPAVLPASVFATQFPTHSVPTQVHGKILNNLSDADMGFLDRFEGDQYVRRHVSVTTPSGAVPVQVYIFNDPLVCLDPRPWVPDDFIQAHLFKWETSHHEYYD